MTADDIFAEIDGVPTPEQAAMLMSMDLGDIDAYNASDSGGSPTVAAEAGDDKATQAGKTVEQPEAGAANADADLTADNAVLMAKDNKHTIPYERLTEAREGERHWKEQALAAQQQLAQAQAEAQTRADAGAAPTQADKNLAIAEQAIAQGADPDLFGDFSEEQMAAGINKLVEQRVAERIDAAVDAKLEKVLAPMKAKQATEAVDQHYDAIYKAHPDADSLAESKELAEWINAQPSFVRDGYWGVLNSTGTTDQIIELFSTFKQASGVVNGADNAQQRAEAAVKNAKINPPQTLSDIAGGKAAGTDKFDTADAMSAVDLSDAMTDWSPAQIEAFLNRRA